MRRPAVGSAVGMANLPSEERGHRRAAGLPTARSPVNALLAPDCDAAWWTIFGTRIGHARHREDTKLRLLTVCYGESRSTANGA